MNEPLSIAGITPGWLIGYLTKETDVECEYRLLPVVSLIADGESEIEPVVMLPDGRTARANSVGIRAFAVGPHDDAEKVAQAHAAGRGRTYRAAA